MLKYTSGGPSRLKYYTDPSKRWKKGEFVVTPDCVVEIAVADTASQFLFWMTNAVTGHTLVMCATSDVERARWIYAISRCIKQKPIVRNRSLISPLKPAHQTTQEPGADNGVRVEDGDHVGAAVSPSAAVGLQALPKLKMLSVDMQGRVMTDRDHSCFCLLIVSSALVQAQILPF